MFVLLLKLTLAPALVATATLAARRSGHRLGGMISGLPVVAGPIVLVLAVQEGDHFARTAAAAAILGIASLVVFCVVYALLAPRVPVAVALLAANVGFGAGTVAFLGLRPPLLASVAITAAAIAGGSWILHQSAARDPRAATGAGARGDLLGLRLLITAAMVLALTALAHGVSAHLAGLLTPFPIITAVMGAFTHARAGGPAALALLAGLTQALVSFLAFFAVLAALLVRVPAPAAFVSATAAAVLVWFALVWWRELRGPAAVTAPAG